jgi:hypothetical protein
MLNDVNYFLFYFGMNLISHSYIKVNTTRKRVLKASLHLADSAILQKKQRRRLQYLQTANTEPEKKSTLK